ncbi:MAG: glutamine-hydrolyzing GMP synthase [Candidatus Lokiarchaeota archaeon]
MDNILVLDFGGQYCHLIARRVRDLGVYSEILPFDANIERIKDLEPKGIILSGGPNSVYEKQSPKLNKDVYDYVIKKNIALLGICYGFHLIIQHFEGKIELKKSKEYGKTELIIQKKNLLFEGLNNKEIVWMSHGDQVVNLPKHFEVYAKTENCPIAAYGNNEKRCHNCQQWALQR